MWTKDELPECGREVLIKFFEDKWEYLLGEFKAGGGDFLFNDGFCFPLSYLEKRNFVWQYVDDID